MWTVTVIPSTVFPIFCFGPIVISNLPQELFSLKLILCFTYTGIATRLQRQKERHKGTYTQLMVWDNFGSGLKTAAQSIHSTMYLTPQRGSKTIDSASAQRELITVQCARNCMSSHQWYTNKVRNLNLNYIISTWGGQYWWFMSVIPTTWEVERELWFVERPYSKNKLMD
jgi:hypothetical protein